MIVCFNQEFSNNISNNFRFLAPALYRVFIYKLYILNCPPVLVYILNLHVEYCRGKARSKPDL